jgi:hypothetical protein
MLKCESLHLLRLQEQYLRFIVENYAELNILEHIEECRECLKGILEALENDAPLIYYGDLFHGNFQIDTLSKYSDYKNPLDFIIARIRWRKKILKELIKKAEMELTDLESRL